MIGQDLRNIVTEMIFTLFLLFNKSIFLKRYCCLKFQNAMDNRIQCEKHIKKTFTKFRCRQHLLNRIERFEITKDCQNDKNISEEIQGMFHDK